MLALIATICQCRQAAPTLTHTIVKADIADLAARLVNSLLNDGAKRSRLLYLKIMYIATRKILHLQ